MQETANVETPNEETQTETQAPVGVPVKEDEPETTPKA